MGARLLAAPDTCCTRAMSARAPASTGLEPRNMRRSRGARSKLPPPAQCMRSCTALAVCSRFTACAAALRAHMCAVAHATFVPPSCSRDLTYRRATLSARAVAVGAAPPSRAPPSPAASATASVELVEEGAQGVAAHGAVVEAHVQERVRRGGLRVGRAARRRERRDADGRAARLGGLCARDERRGRWVGPPVGWLGWDGW
eukprot:3398812-Prymnesium_polylepis.1